MKLLNILNIFEKKTQRRKTMKQLKRILIVIAALALLVTSFAVVIGAEGKTKGDVAKIEDYIAKLEADLAKGPSAVKDQVNRVTSAYGYIHDNETTDWTDVKETPAYIAAIAKLDAYCVQVANTYVDSATAPALSIKVAARDLNKVYKFINDCDPAESTAGYAELWVKMNAKNVELTETSYNGMGKIPEISAETFESEMTIIKNAAIAIFDQHAVFPITDAALLEKYSLKAYDITTRYLDKYEEFLTVATDSDNDYFKKVNDALSIKSFVDKTDISCGAGYTQTMERVMAAVKIANDAKEEKRQALDSMAPLSQYDYGYVIDRDYDGNLSQEEYDKLSVDEQLAYDENNKGFTYPNAQGEHRTYKAYETIDGTENGFLHFNYGEYSEANKENGIHHYAAISLSSAGGREDYGIVIDWDMRFNDVFGGTIPLQAIDTVNKITNSSGGTESTFANLLVFNTSGSVSNAYSSKTYKVDPAHKDTTKSKAIVVDVWTHYTLTYNPETRIGAFYVNYVKVLDIYFHNPKFVMNQLRFGAVRGAENWDGFDMDNFEIFYGTAYRITDKFSTMDDDAQFKYFVDYAGNNDSTDYLSRNIAYSKAVLLAEKYANKHGTETDVYKKFDAIDYDADIRFKAMNQNLEELKSRVSQLTSLIVNTENTEKIKTQVSDIKEFVNKNAALIDKSDKIVPGYQEQMGKVYSIEADILKIEYIKEFVDVVIKFERSATLSARTRHSLAAAEIYELAEYDIEENRKFIEKDPIVVDFEKHLNGQKKADGSYLTFMDEGYIGEYDPEYIDLFEYYESFADILAARAKLENSKNIINAISRITKIKGYEATDAFFAANFKELENYTLLIRGYINSGNYDVEYPGVKEALEEFYKMDGYFYEKLQQQHIATLEDMIAKYDSMTTYIEKLAVVNSIKDYFANEDTALNNTKIKKEVRLMVEDEAAVLEAIMRQNDVYAIEAEGLKDSYIDVLTQQTEYFINIINHMDSIIVFSDIEALFEEATQYYYGINLHVEGASEAADRYAYYRDYIASVKESNTVFEMYVDDLDMALLYDGEEKRDMVYAALTNCAAWVDFVDAKDSDVAELLEFYYSELNTYEKAISAIESAIYEAVQFTNALRTNTLPATVLSVIGKLINN